MHEIQSKTVPSVDVKQVKCIHGFEAIQRDYPVYLTDESKLSAKPFDYLWFPKDELELAAVIREMSRLNIPITIAGARTGLVGGSVPQAGAMISLEYLDKVEGLFYDPLAEEWHLRAQTSLSLKAIDNMLQFKQFPGLEKHPDEWVRSNFVRFKEDPNSYFYPPDPTEMSASLGGSVVTNASGARTYRFGPTRAWVRGLRVFLADGEYLDIPRGKYFASPAGKFVISNSRGEVKAFNIPDYSLPRTKSATGFFTAPQMDLIDLFIGSEGLLGVVSRVDVALTKREPKISIIQFLDSEDQALHLTHALRSDGRLQLDFLEFYSENALKLLSDLQHTEPATVGMPAIPPQARAAIFYELSFDPQQEALDFSALEETIAGCGADLANSWAGYEPRELERLKVFRHLLPETINAIIAERKKSIPALHKLGTDMAVPDVHLDEIWQLYKQRVQDEGLEWAAFGHIGNNHIHVNILPRNLSELEKGMGLYEEFATRAVALGGTVSAEHGIGKIKRKFMTLMYTPEQIEQMRLVKVAIDPQGLFNPQDMFLGEVAQ